jgi:hypothetical protein
MNKIKLYVLCVIILCDTVIARKDAGLILTGVDTTYYNSVNGYGGMDFVLERPCTSVNEQGCVLHFTTVWGHGGYETYAYGGTSALVKAMGKINLDNITVAPADADMANDIGLGTACFMRPSPDSLAQYIGNVYVIKTGEDPREDRSFYAKLKILDFTVRDVENHEIDMVFLWACNIDGRTDLKTGGLDTFTLDYNVDTIGTATAFNRSDHAISPIISAGHSGAFVLNAINGIVFLPVEIQNSGNVLMIFDQRGRLLTRVCAAEYGSRHLVIRLSPAYNGVVVVK